MKRTIAAALAGIAMLLLGLLASEAILRPVVALVVPHDPSVTIAASSLRAGISMALPWAALLGVVGVVCGLTLPGRARAAFAGIVSAVAVLSLTLTVQRGMVARTVRTARVADPAARVMIPIESLHLGRAAAMAALACGLGAAGFSRRRRGAGAAAEPRGTDARVP